MLSVSNKTLFTRFPQNVFIIPFFYIEKLFDERLSFVNSALR